jgi:hypothetical protein
MASKRLFQLIAAVEDQPGVVADGLIALGNAKILVSDPQITMERTTFDRQINRSSLTPLTSLEGVVEATCTFRVEMAGTSTAGAAPDWSLLLRACGLREREFATYPISSQSGNAFYSGERVSGATSGSGEVVHDTWNGATMMYAVDSAVIGNLTGDNSGATATLGSKTAQQGWCWTPRTRPVVVLNGTFDTGASSFAAGDILIGETSGAIFQVLTAETTAQSVEVYILDPGTFIFAGESLQNTSGDNVMTLDGTGSFIDNSEVPSLSLAVIEDGPQRILKGCRGSVTFAANLGEPMFMDFSFRGLVHANTDGQLSGTPAPNAKVPPSFLEIGYGVANDSPVVAPADMHEPCINSWSLAFENDVSIEKCAASTDGTRGAAMLVGRTVTGSFDPSVRPEASFPFLENMRNGTIFRQRLTLGDTAANQFHLSVPACKLTSEGGGDRDGVATRDLQFSASGRAENETDYEDREFTLTYHQDAVYTD